MTTPTQHPEKAEHTPPGLTLDEMIVYQTEHADLIGHDRPFRQAIPASLIRLREIEGLEAERDAAADLNDQQARRVYKAEQQAEAMRFALAGLLADIEEYQTINNLGGENNHWQVIARKALATGKSGEGEAVALPDVFDAVDYCRGKVYPTPSESSPETVVVPGAWPEVTIEKLINYQKLVISIEESKDPQNKV